MADLKNKVVVVTGASAGLGAQLSLEAGRRECRVALLARRTEMLRQISEDIAAAGGEAIHLYTDVSEASSLTAAFAEIENRWENVDLLFNAAGVVEPIAPLVDVSDDGFRNSLLVNVFGVYLATREALKRMRRQPGGGTVVNITSGAATKPYRGWAAYGSQKAAVDSFTRIAAAEMADTGCRVFALSPGPFESHMQETIRRTPPEKFPSRDKFIRLHEEGKLASAQDAARFMLDVSAAGWPELNGKIEDLRAREFQTACRAHGIEIPGDYRR